VQKLFGGTVSFAMRATNEFRCRDSNPGLSGESRVS
jgi:hypothetical protein